MTRATARADRTICERRIRCIVGATLAVALASCGSLHAVALASCGSLHAVALASN